MQKARSGNRRSFAGEDLGQTLVEFALAVPFFLFTVLVGIQLAVFVGQYYNLMQVTRETARYVSVNPDTIDSAIFTYAKSQARPGMLASKFVSLTANPACAALDNGRCADRTASEPVTIEIKYDVSHVIFFPTSFKLGNITAKIPVDLPSYRVAVPVE